MIFSECFNESKIYLIIYHMKKAPTKVDAFYISKDVNILNVGPEQYNQDYLYYLIESIYQLLFLFFSL